MSEQGSNIAYIKRSNLMRALYVAIESNKAQGHGNSSEVLGWQDVLNDLRDGKPLIVEEGQ